MNERERDTSNRRDATTCSFEAQGFPATYAFGALDGGELAEFRQHLEGCQICTAALRDFRSTVAQLPLTVEADAAIGPSPALRTRLLDAVAADLAAERAEARAVAPLPFRARRRVPQAYAIAAVLLLALGLGLIGWNLDLQRGVTQARVERDQAAAERDSALREAGRARLERDQALRELTTTRWQLSAAQAGQSIKGDVIYLRDQQKAVVTIEGLPELQPGQVYQIWLIQDGGAPQPETVFLSTTTAVQANFEQFQTLAVTVEPGPRGSVAPTSPVLVVGNLTH
ncbi:MAG TPA: anti-sigma factor [Thermomicrobiales bacterium]|jgi:anti-sigma-K factor RskA